MSAAKVKSRQETVLFIYCDLSMIDRCCTSTLKKLKFYENNRNTTTRKRTSITNRYFLFNETKFLRKFPFWKIHPNKNRWFKFLNTVFRGIRNQNKELYQEAQALRKYKEKIETEISNNDTDSDRNIVPAPTIPYVKLSHFNQIQKLEHVHLRTGDVINTSPTYKCTFIN